MDSATATYKILPYGDVPLMEWDHFCSQEAKAWFWHTSEFLDYLAVGADNYSFALMYCPTEDPNTWEIRGICPLIFRGKKLVDGYPLPLPVVNLQTSVRGLELFWSFLRARIAQFDLNEVYRVRTSPLADDWTATFALKPFGFHHWVTRASLMMDLQQLEQDRWLHLRKSYRPLIKKTARTYMVMEGTPDDMHSFESFHRTYRQSSRPEETWRIQKGWVLFKLAHLLKVIDRETLEVVGYMLLITYKNKVYNASMVFSKQNLSAFVVWEAMNWAAQQGYRTFEIGWQGMASTKKEEDIEFFRRGFGGFEVPLLIGDGVCHIPHVEDDV